jgi:hypothetical protein
MKQSLAYLATVTAIALGVWAMAGAPMLSHPDSRVVRAVDVTEPAYPASLSR